MDALILKTDFNHNDEEKHENFRDAMDEWSSSHMEESGLKDLVKGLNALADRLTGKDIPDLGSEGWEQAEYAFNEINNIAIHNISREAVQASEFHEPYYNFILRYMEFGPGTIHMRIISECLEDSYLELNTYLKSLKGQKLNRLLAALTKDIRPKEMVGKSEFAEKYDQYISQFEREVFTSEMIQENLKVFLDFYTHLSLDFLDEEEDACETMGSLGEQIYRALDDPWEKFKDIPVIKLYFQRLTTLFKSPNFPSHERALRVVKEYTSNICPSLGTQGLVLELYEDIIDLAVAVSHCSFSDKDLLVRIFNSCVDFFRKLEDQHIAKKPDVFKAVAKKYTEAIEKLDFQFLSEENFADKIADDVLRKAYAKNKTLDGLWVSLIVPLLKRPCIETMRACQTIVSESDTVKWKEHPETARELFDVIASLHLPEKYKDDENKKERYLKTVISITKAFLEGLKKAKMLKEYGEKMLSLVLTCIEMNDVLMFELGEEIGDRTELNIKESKKAIMDAMKRFLAIIKSEEYPWEEEWDLQRAAEKVVDCVVGPVKDTKTYTIEEIKVFLSVCEACQEYDPIAADSGKFPSARGLIYMKTMNGVIEWLKPVDRYDLLSKLFPGMLKSFEENDEVFTMINSKYFTDFGEVKSGQVIAAPHLGQIIQIYLDQDCEPLIRAITAIYPSNPKALTLHYSQLMSQMLDSGDTSKVTNLALLFHIASKMQPDIFIEKDMGAILVKSKEDMGNQVTLLQILEELCKRRPEAMVKHIDKLMDTSGLNPMLSSWINNMISSLALHDKKVAPKALDFLFKSVRTNQDKANLLTSLNAARIIGFKYPDLLKPRRSEVENLQIADADGQSLQQTILDMIDGKTPDDLRKQLEGQQDELNDLVGRVEETEDAIAEVRSDVDRQGQELDTVKNEVNEQGQKLDQVEETVEETVAKVEEIDQKTLSHAPYWSRDVSKLLNPESEHDWRLLSSRLGYSNDDIRSWAQQADPCMAMLNEWYATRKTSEASFAILTQLQEMNRMDAAIIVENAMKNAEAVVEDEDFEYASPPPIFISYQWGHQEEVKLLKQHLEMAGYECWLDIGQMGGGDKLFEKIDNGIRAAKVVISCVTEKYAKSPNCNREVNLSVGLNKSLIPLLMEKCVWPPPGSMGPIFSEFLFIRFYQRAGEELDDQRYWPGDKFQELLMQLSMLGLPPDEGKIQPVYRNWWMPKVEEIKIDKSKTRGGGKGSQKQQEELDKQAAESPDVFISYQWGKQPNIIKLYERLTSLGFTCWLDIKQMGGGDSLYDKIDRGVRGSRVVLSCVTQKYSLSANCRREVSLADALKKPLVPLLLEKMTWPPAGPMSMVMTQLLYIDFAQEKAQTEWSGPKFQELLDKINEHAPELAAKTEEKKETTSESDKKPGPTSSDTGKSVQFKSGKREPSHESIDNKSQKREFEPEPANKALKSDQKVVVEPVQSKLDNEDSSKKSSKEQREKENIVPFGKVPEKEERMTVEEKSATPAAASVRRTTVKTKQQKPHEPSPPPSRQKLVESHPPPSQQKPERPRPPPSQRKQEKPRPPPSQQKQEGGLRPPPSQQKSNSKHTQRPISQQSSSSQLSKTSSGTAARSNKTESKTSENGKGAIRPPPSQQSSQGGPWSRPSAVFQSGQSRPPPQKARSVSPRKATEAKSSPQSKPASGKNQERSEQTPSPEKKDISSPSKQERSPSPQKPSKPPKSSSCTTL
ncbi:uncharacterized protein LOC101855561 [Aplysia californica]|uniref:Uncharacterized protein LOC101855561 n=1 Tax=Aplysia californica TaxID=6500 RepID=A0ABM0ZZM9_APLCA|nr:uncharacterized protein LOC101855561 [Aplysia californica]